MNASQQIAVIGAGPGGYVCAIRLAQLGHRVTLIDPNPLGGTCLHWGCIPSKALIQASHQFHLLRHRHLGVMGIAHGEPALEMPRLQQWKQGIIDQLSGGIAGLLARHQIDHQPARARFTGPKQLTLTPVNQTQETLLEPDAIVLATGAAAFTLPTVPVDGQWSLFAEHLLSLDHVPDTLGIVGAGIIGLELGMMMAQLGAKVWMVEAAADLLPEWDRDVVAVLTRSLKALGVELHLGAKVQAAQVADQTVTVEQANGERTTLPADKLLVAIGRRPVTEALQLDQAGVALQANGRVAVDDQLRTSNPAVFAIGDLVDGPQLAHRASKEGLIVAEVLHGKPERRDWRAMPLVVFTQPEMASVGLTESQAKAQNLPVKVGKFSFAANGMALALNPVVPHGGGFVKWIADADTDEIIGAQAIGPHASTLIAEAALAMELGATAEDLALTIHAHPTLSEPWMEAAEALHGQAIHLYQPRR